MADSCPTDVVKGPDGAWYISQLVGFPFEKGSSTIWRIVPGHVPTMCATGLTNVTSLAFDKKGHLYAVEISANGLLGPPIGALVRVCPGRIDFSDVVGEGDRALRARVPRPPGVRHDGQRLAGRREGGQDRPLTRL